MKFFDRQDAGFQLSEKLLKFKNTDSVILGIPRGGVPVAAVVAARLDLPLDLILVKKIGHPGNPEYALGAAGLREEYLDDTENIEPAYIERELSNIRLRLQEMQRKFKGDVPFIDLKGKNAIVVDDGVATGRTLLATLRILRKSNPKSIVLAVPVISESAMRTLKKQADEVIAVFVPDYFSGVGAFYEHFEQITDEEVTAIMQRGIKSQG